jgi:transcriptional regulator with XRE-family HTH domain
VLQFKFGAVLRACRERAGLSQEKLGELLYHDRSVISRIESDKAKIDAQTLFRWTEVTNAKEVLIAYFCGLDGLQIMQNILAIVGG